MIKHLVISGGSVWGFSAFGILYEALEYGFIELENIQSIYATSVGTIVGTMMALKIERNILKDYLIKRPWDAVCKKNKCSVLELYDSKGIIHKGFIENFFSPLLKSVDLPLDISLEDFYKHTGIECHFYTTELNKYISVELSHHTHPTWKLTDAVYASCAVPILFLPFIQGSECYIDGGFFSNYPIANCLDKFENKSEIFGISLANNSNDHYSNITIESNIFDVLSTVLSKIIRHNGLFANDKSKDAPYQIHCIQNSTIENSINTLYNKEIRQELIESGIQLMKEWLLNTIDKLD